ncbi:MAG: carboxypeptidase regulatory-like domain-containing protein [Acidobacteriia bacterium]|nr:carboxypeptidase regulatory-like domain-containing protein [Terriglobia bacterium]
MRTLIRATVVLFLLTGLAVLSFSQVDGTLVGNVTDASGSAVPNATITATNKDTGVKYSSTTSTAGDYRINNVPVGRYDVNATVSGFTPVTRADVSVELNHTTTTNLSLTVGSVTTVVEVQEAGATIDTSTAQLQTAFDSKQAVDVPLAGISRVIGTSGIYNLSLTSAGVATSGGVGQGTGPSISGQRPENNTFTVDGVDNDDRYVTGPAMVISNEAVAQFNVLQNQFSAEFGGASGGVFNLVVKSGTNSVHGSVYEYLQNRDLNAMDAQYTHAGLTSLPRFDSNRLGATVGGPIIKNKLFYFGNYEYNPLGQASVPGQTVDAPTSAGISLLNGMGNLSKTNLGILEKYLPVAPSATDSTTVNGVKVPIGPLSFASPNYYNTYLGIVAIDYNISDKDQVRGRYVYSNYTGIDFNSALPVFFQPSPSVARSGSISEFHNFSATMENELRVSFRRFTNNIGGGPFKFPGLDAFPNLSFDDLNLQMGPDPNTPTGEIANNLGIQENLTKTLGRHTIKAGYSFSDAILTGSFVQRARGDYDYLNLEEYLLDNAPTGGNLSGVSGERSVGANNGVPFGFLSHAAFVNDDFRLRPNLTLNLGVRYEYVTMPVGSRAQQYSAVGNVPGVITFNKPHFSPNDWSPRIGFAYSPGKNNVWSIRGGFARSFDLTYINLNQNASPPFYQTTRDCPDACAATNFLAGGGLTATLPSGTPSVADARGAVASYTWSDQRPYALTGSLGVQRVFARDYTVEARYVYTKGVHLWNQTRLNILSRVTPTDFLPTYFSMPDPSVLAGLTKTLGDIQAKTSNYMAQYGLTNAIVGYHPWGNSRYNGLQMQLNKRYSRNFSYIVAYTWSHNFDDSTATNFSTILSPRRAQDFQNLRAEWASSALDRRHRFTFTPIYDFKPFQNGNWMMKNVVGNWNISGTYTFQSPEYATVQSGVDSNLNGDSAGDRAIINPAGAANVGSGVTALTNSAGDIVAYVADKSNARYVVAGAGALSNGGRNTFPLDHTNNFDFALTKRINITERFRFDIGAQAFNLFNHAQFVGGYLNDVNPYSTAAISRSFLVPSSSSFGAYNQGTADVGFFPSNSRAVQLVAHFTF